MKELESRRLNVRNKIEFCVKSYKLFEFDSSRL